MLAVLKAWCDGWSIFSLGKGMRGSTPGASVHNMSQIVILDDDDNDGDVARPSQISLTQEQMQRMARQKELALARRLQVEQQQRAGRILPPTFGHPPQALSRGDSEDPSVLGSRDWGNSAHRSTDGFRSYSEDSDIVCLGDGNFRGRGFGQFGRSTQGSSVEDPVCLDAVSAVTRSSEPRHVAPQDADGWKSVRRRPAPGQSFGREVSLSSSPLAPDSLPRLNKKVKVEGSTSQWGQAADPVPSTVGAPQNGRDAVENKAEIKPSQQQMQVLKAIEEGKSVFITGSAGTGKSFLLEFAIRLLKMKHGHDTVFVTASTGMAACAVGGTTLHSFAGIMPGNKSKEVLAADVLHDRRKQEVRVRWLKAKALVIDEISMIDGQFFDALEHIARAVKKNSQAFGGIQLVVTGDFFQLPPIERKGFAFEAAKWSECFDIQMELTQVFRQADQGFVSMLNEIRRGMCSDQTYHRLLSCHGNRATDGTAGVQHTKLYPHKYKVIEENDANLESINSQKYAFPAKDEFYTRSKRAQDMVEKLGVSPMIRLCVGAQVMLLKNLDTSCGLVNGARGVVVEFCPANDPKAAAYVKFFSPSGLWPVVQFAAGVTRVMGPEPWGVMEAEVELARRTQVPLALAWALSVHKCQGMTLDRVETDLSKSFGYGMVYVALSRVKSLEGLRLRGFDRSKIQVDPKVKMFYNELSAMHQ